MKQCPGHIIKQEDFTSQTKAMNQHTRNSQWTWRWVYKPSDLST